MTSAAPTLAECVSRLLEISTNFRAQVSFETAKQVLSDFQVYNQIPLRIYTIGEAIQKAIGPMNFGPGNPNNGGFHHIRLSLGNEGSLVIYAEVSTFYFNGDEKKIAQIARDLQKVGWEYLANENDVKVSQSSISARFWWD